MTLKARVIPCLDVKDGRVVKGVNFVDLVDAGDPVEAAKAYDAAGADELCFLDIMASHEGRSPIFDVVRQTAEQCFMPVTVGGGVRTLEHIREAAAVRRGQGGHYDGRHSRPGFRRPSGGQVRQPVHRRVDGRQARLRGEARRRAGSSSPMAAAMRPASTPSSLPQGAARRGAGELLINSMDRDGTQRRLRHRADANHRRQRAGSGHRVRRGRHTRPSGRGRA